MTFHCDRCARCCRHHVVPVTGADVARLTAHTGLEAEAFLDLLAPDQVDLVGEPESLTDLPGGPRVAVLARQDGACVFLRTDGAGGETCSVHAARPFSCRAYPFDRPASTHEPVGLHPGALCPPESGHLAVVQGGGVDAMEWATVVADRDGELYEHATWLLGFNRRQRLRRNLGRPRLGSAEFLHRLASRELGESALDPAQVSSTEQVDVNE